MVWLAGCSPTLSQPVHPSTQEQEAYSRAFRASDPQAAEQFLVEYPNSIYASNMRDRLEVLNKKQQEASLYEPYRQHDTGAGYREFLTKYPESAFAEEARLHIAALDPDGDFESCRKRDTVEAYQEYLFHHHTDDKYYSAALSRLDELLHPGGQLAQNSFSPPSKVIITTGSLSQQYETLGTVEANTTDIGLSTSDLYDVLFRPKIARAIQGSSPKLSTSQMDERLRSAARQKYGGKADAVINVTYRTNYDGDVFASGLAVHFTESQPTPAATTQGPNLEQKLTELKSLREKGLVTPDEYYEKRGKLLEGF